MKKLLIVFGMILAIVALAAVPAYEKGQYYVWSDATVASNALHYINVQSGWFPYIADNGYRADKWTDAVLYRVDGKACFPRIPTSLMEFYGVDTNMQAQFLAVFNPTIEVYSNGWFAVEVEDGAVK